MYEYTISHLCKYHMSICTHAVICVQARNVFVCYHLVSRLPTTCTHGVSNENKSYLCLRNIYKFLKMFIALLEVILCDEKMIIQHLKDSH